MTKNRPYRKTSEKGVGRYVKVSKRIETQTLVKLQSMMVPDNHQKIADLTNWLKNISKERWQEGEGEIEPPNDFNNKEHFPLSAELHDKEVEKLRPLLGQLLKDYQKSHPDSVTMDFDKSNVSEP